MKQIRSSIFETNSSSVHAISISSKPYILPKEHFLVYFGECGWRGDILTTLQERMSYLYTYIFSFDRETAIKYSLKLFKWLDEDDIPFIINDFPHYYPFQDYFYLECYVDHQSLSISTLEKLFESKDTLYHFLFSDGSAVCIDNGDMDVINEFMKEKENAFYCGW